MNSLKIVDSTLRDGNYTLNQKLKKDTIVSYINAIDATGIDIIDVGHTNGLGGSSIQVGRSALPDAEVLEIAREHIKNAAFSTLILPGFATIKRDLQLAIEKQVDIIIIGSRCTMAEVGERFIKYALDKGKQVWSVMFMTHLVNDNELVEDGLKLQAFGVSGLNVVDSAGALLPNEVKQKISLLTQNLNIPIGFLAHNNFGLAIANTLAAIESGASVVNGTARGFGAGAGKTQLEVLVAVLQKMHLCSHVNFDKLLAATDLAETLFNSKNCPKITPENIISSQYGVFSGFSKPILRLAELYQINPRQVIKEIGNQDVIDGQEDKIVQIIWQLKNNIKS
ncbi:MAG: 4-hydroxy-2-oxovalerate aldolase [Alphaproteobacteria bacterium]|nr:4-hydroxy-2-oxovalerate aldolase [Alphaproteobacteria bacterium]